MMCLYSEDHDDFSQGRVDLHEKGLDLVLGHWDSIRGVRRKDTPYGRLTLSELNVLYETLAWNHFKRGELTFSAPAVGSYLADAQNPDAVLRTMEAQHGVLVEQQRGVYAFSHLSFQEYLSARHLLRSPIHAHLDALMSHFPEPRWREVFLFYAGMAQGDEVFPRMERWLNARAQKSHMMRSVLSWAARREGERHSQRGAAVRGVYLETWLNAAHYIGLTGEHLTTPARQAHASGVTDSTPCRPTIH
jgi:predicted NACHT family NTPase